jgi:REP element-mobilizing transposase RayT
MNSLLERHKVGRRRLQVDHMRENATYMFVHLVWSTWDRVPLLTAARKEAVYACIQAECSKLKAEVIAVGGTEDHVHLLVSYPITLSLPLLIKQAKGVSSHLVTHCIDGFEGFKWQGGYAAFSVSRWDVDRIRGYILNQEQHHRANKVLSELEAVM